MLSKSNGSLVRPLLETHIAFDRSEGLFLVGIVFDEDESRSRLG